MIKHKNGIVTMSLIDLEHCGFDCGLYDLELRASGIDPWSIPWPVAILVNFTGGAVITANTSDETLAKMKEANEKFLAIKARMCEE